MEENAEILVDTTLEGPNRFVSIDFLRGTFIWVMLVLHCLMRVYDLSWVNTSESIAQARIILIMILVLTLFLGGWCGFFLLVSAIGNMISMQNSLKKGKSVSELIRKQVVKGCLLLIFAFLTESLLGYNGYLGNLVFGNYGNWRIIIYRGYHMETIHTIAWCVIINGIVQGLLSRNGGYKKTKRNMLIYIILAFLVILLTPFVWKFADFIIPGYPFAHYEGSFRIVQYPLEGTSTFGDYILLFFLMPLAGQTEPIFPFIAVSFIGSIIGIWITQDHPKQDFAKKSMLFSAIMIIVGLIGTGIMIASGAQNIGTFFDSTWNIPKLSSWLWWFLFLTGCQIFVVIYSIRVIEFRGKAEPFARKTIYFRRLGFIAFSIYNFQFVDVIPRAIVSLFPNIDALHSRVSGPLSLVILTGIFITWWGVTWLWEKVDYIGGMEWFIAVLTNIILPKNRHQKNYSEDEKIKKKWWKIDQLNAKNILINANWINLKSADEVDHKKYNDSKLAFWSAIIGFPVVMFSFFALDIAFESKITEGSNKYNRWAKILGFAGIFFFIVVFLILTFMTGLAL